MPDQIFICYRRDDSAYVTGHINDRLRSEFGDESIFTDVDRIALGVDFRTTLDRMVSECQILLAVIGEDWLTVRNQEGELRLQDPADFVRIEIESALQRSIPVIPLLVEGTKMPSKDDLPDSLQDLAFRNGTQIRPEPDFHTDIERLINSLKKHLQTLPKDTEDERRGHSASEAGRKDELEQERLPAEVRLQREAGEKRSEFSEVKVQLEEEEKKRHQIELGTRHHTTKKRWAAPLWVVGFLLVAGASWYFVAHYQEQVQAAIAALAAIQKTTADDEVKLKADADAEAKREADAIAEAKLKADAAAFISEGISRAALGDHKAAIQNFDEAIRLNAEPAFMYKQRGASYHALGDYKAAVKDYDEAIRLNAEDADAYYDRSASHNALGNHEAAERDLAVAAELNSKHNDPR